MPDRLQAANDPWKFAHDVARSAERRLADAWDSYFRDGTLVPDALVDEVAACRAEAARKLVEAVAAGQGAFRPAP